MRRILFAVIGIALMMPALVFAQDLAQLEREATTRAQSVAVSGGPVALAAEIARELSTIGQYEDFFYVGTLAPALKNFPGETVTAFRSVDVEIQYNLLLWSWRRFAFPGMTPVVKALYQSPPEDYSKMRDLALRRFFDLAPDEARPFMLDELQRTDLRVSMTTLARLGDVTFPEFEPLWLHNLEDGILDERLDAAVRIERFASPAIRAEVRKLYDANAASWSCDVKSAVLGYLARVDKTGSAAIIRQALAKPVTPEGEDCHAAYWRSEPLRPQLIGGAAWPAKAVIVASGPVPGDEKRIQYTVGDQVYRSTEELIARLEQVPAGATIAWTYESRTAGTHLERWPTVEREALIARVQRVATARNIRLER